MAQGYIRTTHDKWNQMDTSSRNDKLELNSDDVYDILREKDYDYKYVPFTCHNRGYFQYKLPIKHKIL